MRQLTTWVVVIFLALSCMAATAQDNNRLTLARELIAELHLEADWEPTIKQLIELIKQGNPTIAPYSDVLQEFIFKYMSWDSMAEDWAKLYASEYTEEELQQLIAFYKTSAAQRLRVVASKARQMGKEIASARFAAHKDELSALIEKRKKELPPEKPSAE